MGWHTPCRSFNAAPTGAVAGVQLESSPHASAGFQPFLENSMSKLTKLMTVAATASLMAGGGVLYAQSTSGTQGSGSNTANTGSSNNNYGGTAAPAAGTNVNNSNNSSAANSASAATGTADSSTANTGGSTMNSNGALASRADRN
jgi:hypothetical protein